MNREDIIRIAKEVGFSDGEIDTCQLMLERFAVLVAQQERKACAKVCVDLWKDDYSAYACAVAIKERGQA